MLLRLAERRIETPRITSFRLEEIDGTQLRRAAAGAHVRLTLPLPEGPETRAYSLWRTGEAVWISVQREAMGRGGSAWLHDQARVGDTLAASLPPNGFPLVPEATVSLLIAGGIGITPILAMAQHLAAAGAAFQVHYAVRHAQDAALLGPLTAVAGDRLILYCDGGDPRRGLPLAAVLADPAPGRHLYVCGPGPLIDATLAMAEHQGWPAGQVHSERFAAAPPAAAETAAAAAFEVVLAQSGQRYRIGPDDTILGVLLAAGHEPLYSCQAGSCGLCVTPVQQSTGRIDHRDQFLSPAQKAAGDRLCLCMSRLDAGEITLDL